jgi:hypothetical protein
MTRHLHGRGRTGRSRAPRGTVPAGILSRPVDRPFASCGWDPLGALRPHVLRSLPASQDVDEGDERAHDDADNAQVDIEPLAVTNALL